MSWTQGQYLLDLMPLRRSSGLTCTSSLGFWSFVHDLGQTNEALQTQELANLICSPHSTPPQQQRTVLSATPQR